MDYLIIHRVGCIFIGRPFHNTRFTMVAFKGQSALISSERCEFIREWLILIWYPIAKTTCASGDELAALSEYTGKYLYFLLKSNKKRNRQKLIILCLSQKILLCCVLSNIFVSQGCLDNKFKIFGFFMIFNGEIKLRSQLFFSEIFVCKRDPSLPLSLQPFCAGNRLSGHPWCRTDDNALVRLDLNHLLPRKYISFLEPH